LDPGKYWASRSQDEIHRVLNDTKLTADKNLRLFRKNIRFLGCLGILGFLGFNVAYAQSHAVHWTQE